MRPTPLLLAAVIAATPFGAVGAAPPPAVAPAPVSGAAAAVRLAQGWSPPAQDDRGGLPPLLRPGERSQTAPPAPGGSRSGPPPAPRSGAAPAPAPPPSPRSRAAPAPQPPAAEQPTAEQPSEAATAPDVRANPQVADIQRRLQAKGYDPGTADGVLGPQTQQAIDRFRSNVGLPPGGVDAELLDALEK